MDNGDEIFTPNGLYVIFQINFQSQELAPCSCSDSSIITEISTISSPNDACTIQADSYCGSDPSQTNYCNVEGFNFLFVNNEFNPQEICQDSLGCTCEEADNYDASATEDDEAAL